MGSARRGDRAGGRAQGSQQLTDLVDRLPNLGRCQQRESLAVVRCCAARIQSGSSNPSWRMQPLQRRCPAIR
jgi:hypothetical protein